MVTLPRLAGRPFGRIRETLVSLVGAARDEPVRWPQVMKAALATGIAWELADFLPGKHPPIFAPLAAMLTVQVTAFESLRSAFQRTVGVIAGVLLAYAVAQVLGLHWWTIALVILVSMALGQALALGTTGSTQVPVSALLVLGIGAATKTYAYGRVLETLLGAAVGVVVSLVVVPPLHLRDSGRAVRKLAEGQAALLRDIAEDLRGGAWPSAAAGKRLTTARGLTSDLARAQEAVERVADSVRLNPRARRARPAARLYREELDALQHVQVQVRGIARTLADEAARGGEIERAAADGTLTNSGPLFISTVAGSAVVAAADSAHAASSPPPVPSAGDAPTRPVPRTTAHGASEPPPFLVAPPQDVLEQLATLLDSAATALADFGAAAVDNEGHVGSPAAMSVLAQDLSETRRAVRAAMGTARAAELTPATWLVVGSILTDLRRMVGELSDRRDTPANVPVYRPRRMPPSPTLRRTFRPRRRGEN